MRISKRSFLEMLAGGTAATAALAAGPRNIAAYHPNPLTAEHIDNPVPRLEPPPRVGPSELLFDPATFYDVVDRTLYDRIHFTPGMGMPAYLRLFSNPLGTTCPYTHVRKGPQRTNMYQSGQLPAPSLFWVRRIHLIVDPASDLEARRIFRKYSWSFWLANKRYQDGTVTLDAQLHKWAESTPNLLAPARESLELKASNGLFIPAQMCFHVEFQSNYSHTLPLADSGLDFTMALEGVEARPVQ